MPARSDHGTLPVVPPERWLKTLHGLWAPLASRAVTALVVLLLALLVMRGVRRLVRDRIQEPALRYRAVKMVGRIGWVFMALVLLAIFSDRLRGVALSLGVVGAGVAFALQEVIASVAGRIAILFGRFFDVGDRVQLGGIKGDVVDIGVLRTTLMEMGDWVQGDLYNGRIVRVANSFVFKEPVYNYSADFDFLWEEVRVPVKYGSDHKLARRLLEQAVHDICGGFVEPARETWARITGRYKLEHAQVEPMVTLIANDNWIEFTLRYVVPYTKRRSVKDELFSRILEDFGESRGKVAMASATYEIVGVPPLDVHVQKAASDT